MRLNRETIKNFDLAQVELTDCGDKKRIGHFVIRDKEYILLPFNDNCYSAYHYKLSHIKAIKFLFNNVELKR